MKTIGLIGGMSWESTTTYYQIINETVKQELGGLHSAKCVLYSVDFQEIEECQSKGEWGRSADILSQAAISLEKAGADFIVICTNTMHKVAAEIQSRISIPILHIAEVTADCLERQGIRKTALLGTKYTMEQDFYKKILIDRSIEVMVPEADDRKKINDIIYGELCVGKILEQSRKIYLDIIRRMVGDGARGVILGCTEIGLLVKQSDASVPLFDTTYIHAREAALRSIAKD